MPTFDEILAQILEEPPEVLGALADVVNRGRMQAEDFSEEELQALARYDLVAFLVQRQPKRPVRNWVYPTPLGLRLFAVLEREAEREERRRAVMKVTRSRKRRDPGVRP